MDTVTGSHAELVAVVLEQQALIPEQSATIERLERRIRELEGGENMPGHTRQQPRAGSRPPRRKRVENHARRRDEPTARVAHALAVCPACGLRLAGGSVKRTCEVIELVPVPATVTEHVYLERCCVGCGKRWTPRVALAGQVVGSHGWGWGC